MAINTRVLRPLQSQYIPTQLPQQAFDVVRMAQQKFDDTQAEIQSFIPEFEAGIWDFDKANDIREEINTEVSGMVGDLKTTSDIQDVKRRFNAFKRGLPQREDIQVLAQRSAKFKNDLANISQIKDPRHRQGLTNALQQTYMGSQLQDPETGEYVINPSDGFVIADAADMQGKLKDLLGTVTPDQEITLGDITYGRDPDGNLYQVTEEGGRKFVTEDKLREGFAGVLMNDPEIKNYIESAKQYGYDPTNDLNRMIEEQATLSAFNQEDRNRSTKYAPTSRSKKDDDGTTGYFADPRVPGTTITFQSNSATGRTSQDILTNLDQTKENFKKFDYQIQTANGETVSMASLLDANATIPIEFKDGELDFSNVTITDKETGEERELDPAEKNRFAANYEILRNDMNTAKQVLDEINTPQFRAELGMDEDEVMTLWTDKTKEEKEAQVKKVYEDNLLGGQTVNLDDKYNQYIETHQQNINQKIAQLDRLPRLSEAEKKITADRLNEESPMNYDKWLDTQFYIVNKDQRTKYGKIREKFDEKYAEMIENDFNRSELLTGYNLETDGKLSDSRRKAMGDKAMAVDIANAQQASINSSPATFLSNYELLDMRGEPIEFTQAVDMFLAGEVEPGDTEFNVEGLEVEYDLQEFYKSDNLQRTVRKGVAKFKDGDNVVREVPFYIAGHDIDRASLIAEGAATPTQFRNNLKDQFENTQVVNRVFKPDPDKASVSHDFGYIMRKNDQNDYSLTLMGVNSKGEYMEMTRENLSLTSAADLLYSKFAVEQAKLNMSQGRRSGEGISVGK